MSDDVEAFEGELRQLRELNGWGFIGPCAHGCDPFTRCDTCERLTPLRAYSRPERPVDACANCVRLTTASQQEQLRAVAEAKRWQKQRQRRRLAEAMADGTPRHEAAAGLGLTTRTAREHARVLKGGG